MTLLGKPLNLEGIMEQFHAFARRFGFFGNFFSEKICSYMLFLVRNRQVGTKQELLGAVQRSFDFQGNVFLQSMGAECLEGSEQLIRSCYRRLIERKLLVETPGDGSRLELTPAGEKRLASNRFFLSGEQPPGTKIGAGSILRIGFSLLVRWTVFLALYWLATTFLLPRLPAIPLWDSIDVYVLLVWGLRLTLFELVHLFAGFLLITQAAIRMSLIYQRHLSIRERRANRYTKLQTGGFYGRVRHPIASNRLLYTLGLFFALTTGWAVVPFAVMLILTILSGIIEERGELNKRFGNEYQAYKREVSRRYLTPWLAVYLGIAGAAFAAGLVL